MQLLLDNKKCFLQEQSVKKEIYSTPSLISLSLLLYYKNMSMIMNKNTFLKLIPLEPNRDLSYLHQEEEYSYPNETYSGLASLCTILKGIQDRLISTGYCIIEEEETSTQRVEHYEKNTFYK